jgi:glycosyltransferase involved in cell wall biosynthesis
MPASKEAFSYTLQRWILRNNFHRGIVTINGSWKNQPAHVFSFLNPCVTEDERRVAAKKAGFKKLEPPYKFLFVGRVESAKGIDTILEVAAQLQQMNVAYSIDIVGDGPEREKFVEKAIRLNILSRLNFCGWQPKTNLGQFYSKAHFILLPSESEGWPKVLSEAMAYGVVPLANSISSIPQILDETGAGFAIVDNKSEHYVKKILHLIENPLQWKTMSIAGVISSEKFTYTHYLRSIQQIFLTKNGIKFRSSSEVI